MTMGNKFDAVLLLGYGGPEKPEDIRPFLELVAKGRPIPKERLDEVAHHYELIGGRSPINEYTYKQAKGLENALSENGSKIPVFVGMRNWHPFIPDTLKDMSDRGVKKAIGMIMAAHQCEASWERYVKDIEDAIAETGVEIECEYTAPLFDHPLFIEDSADRAAECFEQIPPDERNDTLILFSAHSIPVPMAESSPYVEQLTTTARLIAGRLNHDKWRLVYQSRSGRPQDPWLEPDVCEVIREIAKEGGRYLIVQPIGFLCDHVEVLFDIGIEAKEAADEAGITLIRAQTVNDDPKFIEAMADEVKRTIGRSE
ncbi:MAG: ferrochelatase [Thermodesulfobacteriota bacterium]